MILQYFKKKENEYKLIADSVYISSLKLSKNLIDQKFFKEKNFDSSFELITIILILYFHIFNKFDNPKYKKINDFIFANFVNDLDKGLRDLGVSDMQIGKYVKKYVKKFYFRLKKIDLILDDFSKNKVELYLNSLKNIDKLNISKLAQELINIKANIRKNNSYNL
tara:strand:+ start:10063 stop:10557 length:495 start_codon:yes stop_codon:yes gene_type:complete